MRTNDGQRQFTAALRDRRQDLVTTVVTRVNTIGPPADDLGSEYLEGLRLAIEAAIDHTIAAGESGDDQSVPVPEPILCQTRLAARRQVPLATILRRYVAGHAILGDFAAEEAGREGISADTLRCVLRSQASRTDRVVSTISECYAEEMNATRTLTPDRRRLGQIRRLLGGELADLSGLDYAFDCWHLGVVARGPGRHEAIRDIITRVDARRLVVGPDDELLWAWVGTRGSLDPEEVEAAVQGSSTRGLRVGIGEPGKGLPGWRLTYEQAQAALSVAAKSAPQIARYRDVALLAAVLRDGLLATSLRRLYLDPLATGRDGGAVLRETLRAYFASGGNGASAASALGVSRQTVNHRLRAVEERIERPLLNTSSELDTALRLAELAQA
jgi:hypothetical protein